MSITRKQAKGLLPGDVVKLHDSRWDGVTITGPVRSSALGLCVGPLLIAMADGRDPFDPSGSISRTLTVVFRAPRPLYVNHDRAEPVPGDVVRDADSDTTKRTWLKSVGSFSNEWLAVPGHVYVPRSQLPDRLLLLVDGQTGRCVP